MYYLNKENDVKQFDNPKDFVTEYVKSFRKKYGVISSKEIEKMIIDLKSQFELVKEFDYNSKESRLADSISDKRATSEIIAELLLLTLFNDKNVSARKFLIIVSDSSIPEGAIGSTTNQIQHYGICFKVDGEKDFERYLDIDRTFNSIGEVEFFSNEGIRAEYKKDFYFSIISRIYNIKANSFDEYFDEIIKYSDKAEPSKLV